MAEQTTVVGVFEDRTQAAQAIEELHRIGFADSDVGFAARHDAAYTEHTTEPMEQEAAHGPNPVVRGIVGGILGAIDVMLVPITGPADASAMLATVLPVTEEAIDKLPYPGSAESSTHHARPDNALTMPMNPSPPQEAATSAITSTMEQQHAPSGHESGTEGIVTGGIVGGVLGAAVAFFIPGIGPIIAGGILATALGGAALGGIAGGFLGVFTHVGVPEEQARYYEQEFNAGRTIVTVKAANRVQKASAILQQHGASEVQTH